jgi:hypothetical protein
MAWWKEVVEGVICCVRSSVAGEIGGEASQMESQDTAWPIFSHSSGHVTVSSKFNINCLEYQYLNINQDPIQTIKWLA